MIWPTDATRLALTKLKTRKIRLFITLFISSIIFSLLLGASFVVRGVIASVESFNKEGFGERYIVSAYAAGQDPYSLQFDETLIKQVQALEKTTLERKKTEAKRLGIEYDPKNEQPLVFDGDGPNGKQKMVDINNPIVADLILERLKKDYTTDKKFTEIAQQYGAVTTFKGVSAMSYFSSTNYLLTPLKDGKEDFSQQDGSTQQFSPNGLSSISQLWKIMSKDLLQPFLLEGQTVELGADGSLPVIAPFSAAEELVGLKPLPSTASAEAKLERLKEVRSKAAGKTLDLCYRNGASASLVQEALQQQREIESNKSNKEYVKPTLIRDKPVEACGSVRVVADTRTAEEKRLSAKQDEFSAIFGAEQPKQQIMKLRIVGLNADIRMEQSASVIGILETVLTSTLGVGWFSPYETFESNALAAEFFGLKDGSYEMRGPEYFAELPNADAARRIMTEQNCQPEFGPNMQAGVDPFKVCIDKGKIFTFQPFGSSSTAIDEFKKGFARVFKVAAIVVAVLAAIIMMGIIGRIIADSRRETAVFRAIGAKRLDIAQIYLTYTAMLALLIMLMSTALAYGMGMLAEMRYAESMTVGALVTFNVSELSKQFNMVAINLRDALMVWGCILAAAFVAASIPLLGNARRNPIKDMRDER